MVSPIVLATWAGTAWMGFAVVGNNRGGVFVPAVADSEAAAIIASSTGGSL